MKLICRLTLWIALSTPNLAHAIDITQCSMVAEKLATVIEVPAQRHDGQSVKMEGILATPDGDGPFPAIVMVHGSNGLVTPYCYGAVVRQFLATGHVVLIPASTTARGADGNHLLDYSFLDQVNYAQGAAAKLASMDSVDSQRIGVWGHSRGGLTVLHGAASDESTFGGTFKAAIAAAPQCPASAREPVIPTLLVIGANDLSVSVDACTDFANKLESGANFRMLLLPDSGHAFWSAKAPRSSAKDAKQSRGVIDDFLITHL